MNEKCFRIKVKHKNSISVHHNMKWLDLNRIFTIKMQLGCAERMKTQINNIKKTKNKKKRWSHHGQSCDRNFKKKTYKKSRSYSESLQIVNKGQGDDDDDEMEGANLCLLHFWWTPDRKVWGQTT